MAYDFPASPTQGQEYTPAQGGQTYVWFSPRWLVKGTPPIPGVDGTGAGVEEAPMDGSQYGRQGAFWTLVPPPITWTTIPGKPSVFPPESHNHAQSDVVGLPAALLAKENAVLLGTTGQFWRGDKTWQAIPAQDWTVITGKPATFPPSTHGHAQSEVFNLVPDLAGKAPVIHTHAQADITGLTTTLAGKEPAVGPGTTSQFWRGDKTWQSVPTGNWDELTNKPATYPPSSHTHEVADILGLATILNDKSNVGHTHSYLSLTDIPNTFVPSAHVHAQTDVTNLVANLAAKAPLASPVFTGTVTLPVTNIGGHLTGIGAAFSGTLSAVTSISVKPNSSAAQNIHFWFQGFANEERVLLYTQAASSGSFVIRVGGTQSFVFNTSGGLTIPGTLTSGYLSTTGNIDVTGTIWSVGGIYSGTVVQASTHLISGNYVYANAGYFVGSSTLAVLGTAAGGVGDVCLRPAGFNSGAYQTTIDGTTGNLTSSGHVISNTARFLGNTTGVILANNSTGAGTIYLRPNGHNSGVGELRVASSGDAQVYRNLDANGSIIADQNFGSSSAVLCLYTSSANGNIYFRGVNNTTAQQGYYQYNGNLTIGNQGYKAVAGSWAAASDGRIKTVVGDYMAGLKEILQLKVRRYIYKGNETQLAAPEQEGPGPYEDSPHHLQAKNKEIHISLIAQEAEQVMPDLVTRSTAWIDGIKVDDFRTLNPTNVTWALINAVQEMAAQIQTLKGELDAYTERAGRAEYPRLAG